MLAIHKSDKWSLLSVHNPEVVYLRSHTKEPPQQFTYLKLLGLECALEETQTFYIHHSLADYT